MMRSFNTTSIQSFLPWVIALVLFSIPLPYVYSTVGVGLLLLVGLWGAWKGHVNRKWGYFWPIALFGLMVLSMAWSEDLDKSVRGLIRQLPFLLVPLAFMFWPTMDQKSFQKGVRLGSHAMALMALFFMINALILWVNGASNAVFFYHQLVAIGDLNAIYLSGVTAFFLLFLWFGQPWRTLNVLTSVVLTFFLILLSSKNIIATTGLLALVGVVFQKRKNIKHYGVLLLVVLIIALAWQKTPWQQRWNQEFSSSWSEALECEGFTDIYPWSGTTLRVFFTRVFYEQLSEDQSWHKGYGINAGQAKIAQRQNKYYVYCGYNTYNLHNQYWQTVFELGLLGGLLLLGMLGHLVWLSVKTDQKIILFFAVLMAALFVTETYVWRQRGMLHFLVIYGLMVHVFTPKTTKT